MKNNRRKYLFNIGLILLLGFLVFYFTVKDEFNESINVLLEAKISWVVVLAIMMLIFYLLDALNLYTFGKIYKKDYCFKQAFTNSISGILFNGLTPFSSGGQFAQVYIFNKQGISPTNSASILLMAFIVYQSVLVLFTALVMIFRYQSYSLLYSNFFSLAIIGFLINFLVIITLFLGAKSKRLQDFFCNGVLKFLTKIKIIKNYEETTYKFNKTLTDFRNELNNLQNNKPVIIISAIFNLLKLLILYSIPFFCAKALNLNIAYQQIFDIIGICSFVYMITAFVPIPGASGGSEGVYYLLFSPIFGNIGTPTTLLLWRFMTYYLGLLVGGLVFATSREINRME